MKELKNCRLIYRKSDDKLVGKQYPIFNGVDYVYLQVNNNFYSVLTTTKEG